MTCPPPSSLKNRRGRGLLWLWALTLLTVLPALAEPMVVFLKNGDRLSGEITSENDRRIVLKTAITGRITIPRDQIDHVISATALANSLQAAATNAPAPTVAVATPAAPTPKPAPAVAATPPVAPAVLTNAPPLKEPWFPPWFTSVWTNWHGNAQLGANLGFGTTDRHALFVNSTASKKWGRTTSFLNYNMAYGVVNGVENANRMAGDAKVDVEFSNNRKLYAYGQGGSGYDEIREINLEYHLGTGLGYKFIDRPKMVLAGELGAQYQAYDYLTAPDKDNIAARFGENFTTAIGDKLTLTQRFGFTPGIGNLSDYQILFGVTLSCPLFKPLTLNINLADEYDSQPAPNITNNDLQISTTIGITF